MAERTYKLCAGRPAWARKSFPMLEAVSKVQRDGQNFRVVASRDAEGITVQIIAAEAYLPE